MTEFCLKLIELGNKKKNSASQSPKKSALKQNRTEKVKAKIEKKSKIKGVQFNNEVDTYVFSERRWNDFKTRGHTFKKGNFTKEEIKTLMNAVC